ncbi:MAG: hypothetical protein ABI113_20580 [Mucilaginibacter sp.]
MPGTNGPPQSPKSIGSNKVRMLRGEIEKFEIPELGITLVKRKDK